MMERKTSESKTVEVTGGLWNLSNDKLHYLYFLKILLRNDNNKENDMYEAHAHRTHGIDGKCILDFNQKTWTEQTAQET